MKSSSFFLLLLLSLLLTASTAAVITRTHQTPSSAEAISTHAGGRQPVTMAGRKLKEKAGDVILEDYRSGIDPAPSMTSTVEHGPIEYGSPIIPYIPKTPTAPAPASRRTKHAGFP